MYHDFHTHRSTRAIHMSVIHHQKFPLFWELQYYNAWFLILQVQIGAENVFDSTARNRYIHRHVWSNYEAKLWSTVSFDTFTVLI